MQLDNYVFQGNYEDTIGTTMVFKEDGMVEEWLDSLTQWSLAHISKVKHWQFILPALIVFLLASS